MTGRTRLLAEVAVPWRRAILAAALCVMLGALARELASERSAAVPASTRSARASSQRLWILPAAAQAPVSAALGNADPSYRVSSSGAGFQAVNQAQRLHLRFERSSVWLSSGAASLSLSLDGVGYGGSSSAAGEVLSRVDANRVVYRGAALSEWYVNGPLGLEQGFTINTAPAGHPSGPLTLSMALAGHVHATLASGGTSVLIGNGRSSLRYGDLVATDARGHTLRSWLSVSAGRILLRLDTSGARYPLRIDPLVQQAKLTAGAEGSAEGRFAASVALSADGNTALVGAPGDDNGAGAAWLFTRSGSTWTQQGPKLTAGEAHDAGVSECEIEEPGEEPGECGFGKSVALSGDGETALVGAPGADGNLGAVWVFVHSESGWAQQGPALMGANELLKGHFGRSLALSSDGDTALIGAPGDAGYAGAAWVFTRSGTSWSEQLKLTPPESGSIDFGRSVALSGDGDTALIGAPAAAARVGAAWIFTDGEAASWTARAKLEPGVGAGEARFGYSVALSADASTALVGERNRENTPGAAWAFTHEGASWSEPGEPQELAAGGGAEGEDRFGYSVALSADGTSALVGDPGYDGSAGAAWLFTRSGLAYGAGEALTASGEHGSGQLGADVAVSAGGELALLGAPGVSARAGAAWAFVVPGAPPQVTGVSPSEGPAAGGTEVTIAGSDFSEVTAVDFGSVAAREFTVSANGTSIIAVSPKESAGLVHVTVSGPGVTSATSASDLFTFLAGAKTTGHRPAGGNEPEATVTDEGSAGSVSTPGASSGQQAVLAFRTSASNACGASLLGKSVTVRKRGRATLKLTWEGTAATVVCRGKLTLEVKVKVKSTAGAKQRHKTVIIGIAGFSVLSGKATLVTVKLNARGRARLSAAHGRLAASLIILVSSPVPQRATASAVRLVRQRASKPRPHHV